MLRKLFYIVKPYLSRSIQLYLRRRLISYEIKKFKNVWPILPGSEKQPANWKGWPDGKKFAVILTHDVEHQRGYERVLKLMQIEKEIGFVSSFNFVPERDYKVKKDLLDKLRQNGFDYGVHGLHHDGKLFSSEEEFLRRAKKINSYLKDWDTVGFRAPSMLHDLDLIGALDIEYDLSTFDTDPFEPQPDGVGTIFPFWVKNKRHRNGGYVEMPYTLPQDFTPFILMRENTLKIWTDKLDWIAKNGGMVLVNVHPDYVQFEGSEKGLEDFPISLYQDFLKHIKKNYEGLYWNVLPNEVAKFVKGSLKLSTTPDNNKIITQENKTKKICMVVQSNYDGDPRVRRQASILVEEGYSLEVLSLGSKNQPKSEIVDKVIVRRIMTIFPKNNVVIYFLSSTFFFIKAFFTLNYLSLKNRYSLIQIHNMPDHLVFVALFQRIFGTPVLLDIHDLTLEFFREKWSNFLFYFMYPALRFFEFLSCKFSTHILTVTQQCVSILNKRGVPDDKITLILNTADENQFPFYKERIFKEFTEGVNIFYHGTIAKRFGLHLVIEALPKVLNILPGTQLFLYGGGDKDYIVYLNQLVNSLNLENKVHIPGIIKYDMVNEHIKNMDMGIVPYLDTSYMNLALSTKAFEYISCGIPICASRLEATQTIFRESSISYFDPNNIDDISEKIISLAKNPDLQELQVKSALEDLEKISGKVMGKRYLEVINKLVK